MAYKILLLLIINLLSVNISYADIFPLREQFPEVKVITAEDLHKNLDRYLVIDVRSRYEFDVVHINNARNVPLSNNSFISVLKRIRARNPNSKIVFYCNGILCSKSYKASIKAQDHHITNVFTMDWGVLNWVKKYPHNTTLMGETPANLDHLISNETLSAHTLSPAEFVKKINDQAVVIDVRDTFQRTSKILEKVTHHVPLGKANSFAKRQAENGKTLLIYDEVGKQVRWLQYYLEHVKIKNYYFMEKGVEGYLGAELQGQISAVQVSTISAS